MHAVCLTHSPGHPHTCRTAHSNAISFDLPGSRGSSRGVDVHVLLLDHLVGRGLGDGLRHRSEDGDALALTRAYKACEGTEAAAREEGDDPELRAAGGDEEQPSV